MRAGILKHMSSLMNRLKLNHLAISYIAVLIVVFGGVLINNGLAWYYTLRLPVWHPSALVIMLVWTIIYLCGAWSLLIIWNGVRCVRFPWIISGFGLLVFLNLAWSVSFFQLHLLSLALWIGALFGVSVLGLMMLMWSVSKRSSLLLMPFAVWIAYALCVEYAVFALNA